MNRSVALPLYRQILRLHQSKLPDHLRTLGDSYVRQEFRAHQKADDDAYAKFVVQWTEYRDHLDNEAGITGLGRELPDDVVRDGLNDEQKVKLDELRQSAYKIGKDTEPQ